MKSEKLLAILLFTTVVSCQPEKETKDAVGSGEHEGHVAADTVKKSIPKKVSDKIGKATLTLTYHAPAVRGRTIWGGLVPYGEVWVTGAHRATTLEIDETFEVGGKRVDPGKYAFFTIPTEDTWTIILNKNWDQHLADEYDEKDDVIRFVVPAENDMALQNRLSYDIVDYEGSKGAIVLRWEKVKVAVPIHVK